MKHLRLTALIIGIIVVVATIVYFIIKFSMSDRALSDYVLPKLKKVEMQLTDLTADKADMKVNMLIYNPSPISINIDSLYYTISIEGTEIVKSTYPKAFRISSSGETNVSYPLSVEFKNFKNLLNRMQKENRDSANYHVNATVFINSKFLPKKRFDLEFDQWFPLVWFPEVKLKGIKVDKVRLNGGTILVNMNIKNKNVFDLSFKDLSYQMKFEDHDWMKGNKPEVVDIPARQSANVTMPVELNVGELGKSLFDMITKGDKLRYQMKMKASLVSDNKIIQNSKIQMNAEGSMKSVEEAATGKKKD